MNSYRLILASTLLILCFLGCTSQSENGDSTRIEDKHNWIVELVKMVPYNSGTCSISNLEVMKTDRKYYEEYDFEIESYEERFGTTSIDYRDLSSCASANGILVCRGDIDRESITKKLEIRGFDRGTKSGFELWSWIWEDDEKIESLCIAFHDDMTIIGSSDQVTEVIQGNTKSLYDNPEFCRIINDLPSGINLGWATKIPEDFPTYSSLIQLASSYDKNEGMTLMQYPDHESAQKAKTELEKDFADSGMPVPSHVNVSCEDVYVVFRNDYMLAD